MIAKSRLFRTLIFCIFPSVVAFSQNEMQFKSLIKGRSQLVDRSSIEEKRIRAISDFYKIDLNGDGHFEGLAIENSDLGSSIHFFKNHFEHFQELRVASGGTFSKIDRVEVKSISQNEGVIIIYFTEGLSKYLTLRSRQRLYVVYIPPKLFEIPFRLNKGPVIFEEYSNRQHYHVRKYDVSVEDLNKDGRKEILIRNKKSERVMRLNDKNDFILM